MAKVKPMEPTKAIYHSLQGDFEVIVIGSYKAFGKVYLNLEGYPNGISSDRVTIIKEIPIAGIEATAKTSEVKSFTPQKAVYHAADGDIPVTVVGFIGDAPDGRDYLKIEGSDTAIPADRVTPIKEQPADPLGVIQNLSVYNPERLESNQKTFEAETSGISYVIRDEWNGQIQTGRPFDDAIEPYIRDNPDKEFRFLSTRDSVQKSRGMRGYQPVIQADGKPLQVAGMPAGWIPKEEAQRRAARKIQQAEGMLSKVQSDYKEAEARAMHDGEGAFIPTKADDATFEGERRVG